MKTKGGIFLKKFLFIFLSVFMLFFLFSCSSQPTVKNTENVSPGTSEKIYFTVSFLVTVPQNTDYVYIMGDFNNWNPGDEEYRLKKIDSVTYSITLSQEKGRTINFKFSKGTLFSVETDSNFYETDPRTFRFDYNNDEARFEVENWLDNK